MPGGRAAGGRYPLVAVAARSGDADGAAPRAGLSRLEALACMVMGGVVSWNPWNPWSAGASGRGGAIGGTSGVMGGGGAGGATEWVAGAVGYAGAVG
jgi:hypothetical protein